MNGSFFERVDTGATNLLRSILKQVQTVTSWSRDNAGFIVKWLIIAVVAFVVLKGLLFYFGYEMALGYLWGTLGFDKTFASPIAFFIAVLSIAFGPSVLWYALWWNRKRELVVVGAIISVTLLLGSFFTARGVFVDRISGVYTKCYLKTLEGFKFSSTCDFDPETGVQFQKMTPEVMEEYSFWKKNGKFSSIPMLEEGKFFDLLTGKPIVWYVERSKGRIVLSPLPGFDPVSGVRLKPITREIIEQYNLEGTGQTQSHIAPPVSKQEMARLTEDIVEALDYIMYVQSSIFQSEKSEKALNARRIVWKWYSTSPVIWGTRAESVVVTRSIITERDWDVPNATVHVAFQVEPVIRVGEYTIIPVAGRNESSTDEAKLRVSIEVLDRSLHPIHPNFEMYETWSIETQWGKFDENGRRQYIWHLNPNETSRILFVLKNADYEQVRTGALSVRGRTARYW